MKADLLADLRKRAAELNGIAKDYHDAGIRQSAAAVAADAKLLFRAVKALDVDADDLDELARRHVEGAEGRP